MTNYPPDHCCSSCGEVVPVRTLDYDGYMPNELICEGCFRHEVMCWDDLPQAVFPREED